LDEHDARVRADEGRDQRAVVGAVGQCFGRDDDVVPLTGSGAGRVGVGGGGGYRGEDGVRTEGVVAEGVGLEVDAIVGEGLVV
jgi:hypothetical protein